MHLKSVKKRVFELEEILTSSETFNKEAFEEWLDLIHKWGEEDKKNWEDWKKNNSLEEDKK